MIELDPVTGPECVRCGCRDCVIITQLSTIPNPTDPTGNAPPWVIPGHARCKHCETRFRFTEVIDEPKEIKYIPPNCPRCKSEDVKIRSSPKAQLDQKKRYMRCNACKADYIAVEQQ